MHLRLGLAVLVQLDGYLRPSEVLSLTREHLVPPSGPRYSLWGIVVCLSELGERTKTGTTDDSIFIGDLSARSWMSPGLNLSYWRSRIAKITQQLGYAAEVVQPHIPRHSGASNDRAHFASNPG